MNIKKIATIITCSFLITLLPSTSFASETATVTELKDLSLAISGGAIVKGKLVNASSNTVIIQTGKTKKIYSYHSAFVNKLRINKLKLSQRDLQKLKGKDVKIFKSNATLKKYLLVNNR